MSSSYARTNVMHVYDDCTTLCLSWNDIRWRVCYASGMIRCGILINVCLATGMIFVEAAE